MAIRSAAFAGTIIPVGGPAGSPGQSTYAAWLALGNTGSLADFIAAQKGAPGGVTTLAGKTGALSLADIGALVATAAPYSLKGNLLGAPASAADVTLGDLSGAIPLALSRAGIAASGTVLQRFKTLDGATRFVGTSAGPDAIQNASGDWICLEINDGFGNLTHWGGDPLGNAPSDAALAKLMAWVSAGNGSGIYAPGRYLVTNTAATGVQRLTLVGRGKEQSAIVFTPPSGAAAGILFDIGSFTPPTDPNSGVVILDISLLAGRAASAGDIAVRFRQVPDVNYQRSHQRLRTAGVRFSGVARETTGWGMCFDLHNVLNATHVGIELIGQGGAAFPNNTQALNTVSACAYRLTGGDGGSSTYTPAVPCEHQFLGGLAHNWNQVFDFEGDIEGIYIFGFAAVDVRDFVTWNAPAGQGHPLLTLIGCHANVYRSVVRGSGLLDATADASCQFYHNPSATEACNLWYVQNAVRHKVYATMVGYGGLNGYPGQAINVVGNVKDCDFRPLIVSDASQSSGLTTNGFAYGVYVTNDPVNSTANIVQPTLKGVFGVAGVADLSGVQILSDGRRARLSQR